MMRTGQQEPAVQGVLEKNHNIQNAPIGIFDSGIGGLTVVKEVMRQLPNEQIIYLGDTARVPYGTKSDRTIKAFTLQCCLFLLEHEVKMIVIGCNTASSVALEFIAKMFRIPVIGVIKPGAAAAVEKSSAKKIGVIGTHTTVNSHSYKKNIKSLAQEAEVFSYACPLFVPLAEEGWIHHDVTARICEEYLKAFEGTDIDTLVMGCTHYPILSAAIQQAINGIMKKNITLIDSGVETAKVAKQILVGEKLSNTNSAAKTHKFYVTDLPKNFERVGEQFLGSSIDHLEMVSVETLGF